MRSLSTCILACITLMALPANWMHRLSDDAFVASLSIPGSHDSGTGEGFGEGGQLGEEYARTQDLTIAQQWAVGIRAFDLRPAAYQDHLHIHHGIVRTEARFDSVLYQLRDSLVANPSEFVIIHLLHENDGDAADNYNEQLLALLNSDALKPFLVDFNKALTVGEMRGKILILSRDKYATKPIGGFFDNWTGSNDWERMTAAKIIAPVAANGCGLYVQDYSDTHGSNGVNIKITAMKRLLTYSFSHKNMRKTSIAQWYFNFASAYSLVANIFGYEVSRSDGYRDNAAQTHRAILDFIAGRKTFGPTGIVLMDYVGVDRSGEYETLGLEVVNAIIENNFRYLQDVTSVQPLDANNLISSPTYYTLSGQRIDRPQQGQVTLVLDADGTARKVRTN